VDWCNSLIESLHHFSILDFISSLMIFEFVAWLFTGTKHQIWGTCIAHTQCFKKIQEIKVTYSFCRTPSFIQENCSLTKCLCTVHISPACDSSEQERMLLKHPLQNECFIIPCLQHLTKSCDKSLEWTCKRRQIQISWGMK
jgi:hypothetical protein